MAINSTQLPRNAPYVAMVSTARLMECAAIALWGSTQTSLVFWLALLAIVVCSHLVQAATPASLIAPQANLASSVFVCSARKIRMRRLLAMENASIAPQGTERIPPRATLPA